MVDKKEVNKSVITAFKLLAKQYQIPITNKDLPSVEITAETGAYYNPPNRTIYIPPEKGRDGVAIFEEASHALRDLVRRKAGVAYEQQDPTVQEFFGRIGETLGRDLAKEENLDYLFWRKSRDVNDPELRAIIGKRLIQARKTLNLSRTAQKSFKEGQDYLRETTHSNNEKVMASLRDYQNGKIDYAKLGDEIRTLEKSYITAISSIKSKKPTALITQEDFTTVKAYLDRFSYLNEALDIASKSDEKGKKYTIKRADSFLREGFSDKLYGFDTSDLSTKKSYLAALVDWHVVSTHRKGYGAAQQYSTQDLLKIKNLYELTDEEVRRDFFKRKSSKLERLVVSIIAISGLCASFFFLDSSVTSNAIGSGSISRSSGSLLGISLFLVGIAGVFWYFRSKKR